MVIEGLHNKAEPRITARSSTGVPMYVGTGGAHPHLQFQSKE